MNFSDKLIFFIIACGFSLTTSAQRNAKVILPQNVQQTIDADTTASFHIRSISIQGNKKTKEYIIRREMKFKEGDSIPVTLMATLLEQSRDLIYNTTLFTEVKIEPVFDSISVSLAVTVQEKWYLYPAPQFKLVDRNINEWLERYDGDLERVIYGIKFAHYNFSGRRDQLRIFLLTGYARNISVSYSAPYSNQALTEGFAISAGYTQNREVAIITDSFNILRAHSSVDFVRESFGASGAYIKRKGFYNSHIFSIGYSYINADDSIRIKSGGDYLNGNKNSAGFPEFSYSFRHIKVDNVVYPLKGNVYTLNLFKRGIEFSGGTNLMELGGYGSIYLSHGKNWYSSYELTGKIKAPGDLAYINRRALGFGDFYLRGLENYVIDGTAAVLAQATLKKKILSFNIPVPFKIKAIPNIPVTLFAKTFADAGTSIINARYDSRLNNRLLYTAGFGLDILTLYDINFKLEYSFNQLGQNGLFLHAKGGF